MARILIVGGGCRGRLLARELLDVGHAVRITSREGASRAAIEAAGAECWSGSPDRLATLRAALDGVTVLAWTLGTASGSPGSLRELYTTRLEFFITQAIDTTVRGFIYEACGSVPREILGEGEAIVFSLTALNVIPCQVLREDPGDPVRWVRGARAAVQALLAST